MEVLISGGASGGVVSPDVRVQAMMSMRTSSRTMTTTTGSIGITARSVMMTMELPPNRSPDKGDPGNIAHQTLIILCRQAFILFNHGQFILLCLLILVIVIRVFIGRALTGD